MKKALLVAAVAALAATAAQVDTTSVPTPAETDGMGLEIIVPLLFIAAVGAAIWLL